MAQLGWKTALVVAAMALAGCGARTISEYGIADGDGGLDDDDTGGEDAPWQETGAVDTGAWDTAVWETWGPDTAPPPDTGWDTGSWDADTSIDTFDTPPRIGFESYTARVTNVSVRWEYTGNPGTVVPASQSWVGRFDIDRGSGLASVVVSAPFTDSVTLTGCCREKALLVPKSGTFMDATSGVSNYQRVRDSYTSLVVVYSSDGRPIQAKAFGRIEATMGDVVYSGQLETTLSLGPDRTRPTFRATADKAFGSVALPWDERVYEASEPYEQYPSTKELLGPGFYATVVDEPLVQSDWWGMVKHRGIRFHLTEWDKAAGLSGYPIAAPTDLAGNLAEVKPLPFGGVDVPRMPGPSVKFSAGLQTLWGSAQIVTTGCKSSTSCLQIGPFRSSWCRSGSAGGIAVRLPGGGTTTATARVLAKYVPSGFGGMQQPRTDVLRLGVAKPGTPMTSASDVVQWSSASSDGTYDTGWFAVSRSSPGSAETGIAISGGGLGVPSTGCGGFGPAPIEHDVTIMVDTITLSP